LAEVKNKLSHSAVSRYLKCPQSFKYHYVKKVRPDATSSALLFGSALDTCIEEVLKDANADYMKVFWENWEKAFINKTLEEIPLNTKVAYAKTDMDWDLLQEADLLKLDQFIINNKLEYIAKFDQKAAYKECVKYKEQRAHRHFKEKEHQYLNLANWLCMARKAPLMVEAFKKHMLPRITKVISTQKEIKLENEDGDVAQGYLDMVVELDDGKTYVLDLKTSARQYDDNAAAESPQLSLYAFHEGVKNIGYVVLYKNIAKNKVRTCTKCNKVEANARVKTCSNEDTGSRCQGELSEVIDPEARLQLITSEVDESYTKAVIENFDTVNSLVKQGIFYRNFDACSNWFGQVCPFKKDCLGGSCEDT